MSSVAFSPRGHISLLRGTNTEEYKSTQRSIWPTHGTFIRTEKRGGDEPISMSPFLYSPSFLYSVLHGMTFSCFLQAHDLFHSCLLLRHGCTSCSARL